MYTSLLFIHLESAYFYLLNFLIVPFPSLQDSSLLSLLISSDTMCCLLQIEPESQTQLLDSTMKMEGVLLAGVPGAGGFDAVFAITLGASGENVIKAWSSSNVLALLVREDPRGVSVEKGDPRAMEITSGVSSIKIE